MYSSDGRQELSRLNVPRPRGKASVQGGPASMSSALSASAATALRSGGRRAEPPAARRAPPRSLRAITLAFALSDDAVQPNSRAAGASTTAKLSQYAGDLAEGSAWRPLSDGRRRALRPPARVTSSIRARHARDRSPRCGGPARTPRPTRPRTTFVSIIEAAIAHRRGSRRETRGPRPAPHRGFASSGAQTRQHDH